MKMLKVTCCCPRTLASHELFSASLTTVSPWLNSHESRSLHCKPPLARTPYLTTTHAWKKKKKRKSTQPCVPARRSTNRTNHQTAPTLRASTCAPVAAAAPLPVAVTAVSSGVSGAVAICAAAVAAAVAATVPTAAVPTTTAKACAAAPASSLGPRLGPVASGVGRGVQ